MPQDQSWLFSILVILIVFSLTATYAAFPQCSAEKKCAAGSCCLNPKEAYGSCLERNHPCDDDSSNYATLYGNYYCNRFKDLATDFNTEGQQTMLLFQC